MLQVNYALNIEDESLQLLSRIKECINSLKKKDIIELKEQYQNNLIKSILHLLCIIKGKRPTWEHCRELLNPLTFHIEFAQMNIPRLKQENIYRVYNYLIANKELFNTISHIHPAAVRILEWINIVVILYKHKAGKEQVLPEISEKKNKSFDVKRRRMMNVSSITVDARCCVGEGVRGSGIITEVVKKEFKSKYRRKLVSDLLKDTTKLESFLDRLSEPKEL